MLMQATTETRNGKSPLLRTGVCPRSRLPAFTEYLPAAHPGEPLEDWYRFLTAAKGILEPHGARSDFAQSTPHLRIATGFRPVSGGRWGAGFAAVGRFVAEIDAAASGSSPLRPGYVLAGDEIFLLDRCRAAVVKAFVPPDLRDFCLSDLDLANTSIFEALDRAQTPSLMSPFQVIFIRNVRQLYTRGTKKEEFAALERYFASPNPQALLLFVADFLRIPSDSRRMELDDKNLYERLTETLGSHCGMVELARVNEEDAMRWAVTTAQESNIRLEPDAARELVDALGADMLMI